jgi:hypothetical protein
VAAELAQARAALADAGAAPPVELDGDKSSVTGSAIWAGWVAGGEPDPLVRTGVAPKDLGKWLVEVAPGMGEAPFVADIASGLVYTRGGLVALRPAAERFGGYSIVAGGSSGDEDLWGRAPEGLDLMRGLKARWDPAGAFNPAAFR